MLRSKTLLDTLNAGSLLLIAALLLLFETLIRRYSRTLPKEASILSVSTLSKARHTRKESSTESLKSRDRTPYKTS
jgi:Zn-dependent protease with chaperone function